jgi:hypothetical protein
LERKPESKTGEAGMLDQANRWRPVTSEYQEELVPSKRRTLRDRFLRRRAAGNAKAAPAELEVPAGVLGVTCFYLLNAGAYFVSGSILLSFPISALAFALTRHAHLIVPFPVRPLENVPFSNLLAESLFIMAVVSAGVAVLWMTRSTAARWVTILYAVAWLVRNALYLFPRNFGAHLAILSGDARGLLLLDSFAEALIFLYLLFYLGKQSKDPKLKS